MFEHVVYIICYILRKSNGVEPPANCSALYCAINLNSSLQYKKALPRPRHECKYVPCHLLQLSHDRSGASADD